MLGALLFLAAMLLNLRDWPSAFVQPWWIGTLFWLGALVMAVAYRQFRWLLWSVPLIAFLIYAVATFFIECSRGNCL
jgi:hypothetical protein